MDAGTGLIKVTCKAKELNVLCKVQNEVCSQSSQAGVAMTLLKGYLKRK
jgi:hypothetical protein